LSDELFAGAAFAGDEDGGRCIRHLADQIEELDDTGMPPNEANRGASTVPAVRRGADG
jgi:hypothetical protein